MTTLEAFNWALKFNLVLARKKTRPSVTFKHYSHDAWSYLKINNSLALLLEFNSCCTAL